MVPSKDDEEETFRLKYIGANTVVQTGDLALNSAKLEIVRYGDICRRVVGFIKSATDSETEADFQQWNEKLIKYEEITDQIEKEIATYLAQVTKGETSYEGIVRVRSFYRIIGEMESLGDSGESIGRSIARAWAHSKPFTEDMITKIDHMTELVDEAFEQMHLNLETPLVKLHDISNAERAEERINAYRDMLREEHLAKLEDRSYPYETGSFYMDVVNGLEKMGDFIINISQSTIAAKDVR
jgi:phosphate:Na+ symporter